MDPVTGKERVLRETCADDAEAAAALARLLRQAEGHQAPSRNVTFGQVQAPLSDLRTAAQGGALAR